MKIIRIIGFIFVVLSISNCAVLSEADQEPKGRIGFGVHSTTLQPNPGFNGQGLVVTIIIKHDESELIHEMSIPFEAKTRVVFLENLKPGNYTISEYSSSHSFTKPFKRILKPALTMKVEADQTSLFPKVVSMSEIYLGAGLSVMNDKDYWKALIEK